jgi:peptidylamidoglycolate lyase
MKSWKLIVFWGFLVALTFMAVVERRTVAAQKDGYAAIENVSDPYEVDPNWPQPLSADFDWSSTESVFAESPNRVYVCQTGQFPRSYTTAATNDSRHPNWTGPTKMVANRCGQVGEPCVPGAGELIDRTTKEPIPGTRWAHILNVFDAQGKLVEPSFEQYNQLFTHPHTLSINPYDPQRHLWLVDDASDQIFKFTHDGKTVALTLGEFRVHASDESHLGGPNGIAFLPNGDFYVTDGNKNFRVVKFSPDGKYLMEWGKKGNGPGEFNAPHGVAIAADGRIYVGDRGNLRIQIFDKDTKYLSEIDGVYPDFIAIAEDQRYLNVVQGGSDAPCELRTYTLEGRLIRSWGVPFGDKPGQLWGCHGFDRDSDGNLYFAESWGGRVWKYRPKQGADPKLLVGPLQNNSLR